jgi:hypothetical protein
MVVDSPVGLVALSSAFAVSSVFVYVFGSVDSDSLFESLHAPRITTQNARMIDIDRNFLNFAGIVDPPF